MLKVNKSGLYQPPQSLALFLLGFGNIYFWPLLSGLPCSLVTLLRSAAAEPGLARAVALDSIAKAMRELMAHPGACPPAARLGRKISGRAIGKAWSGQRTQGQQGGQGADAHVLSTRTVLDTGHLHREKRLHFLGSVLRKRIPPAEPRDFPVTALACPFRKWSCFLLDCNPFGTGTCSFPPQRLTSCCSLRSYQVNGNEPDVC